MTDPQLLQALAAMWRERDPEPPDLTAQMCAAVQAAREVEGLATEYELLTLLTREGAAGLGVRGEPGDVVVIELTGRDVEVLLRLAEDRIDGWVAPAAAGSARLVPEGAPAFDPVMIDDDGRFAIPRAPRGLARLRVSLADGRRYETPPFHL